VQSYLNAVMTGLRDRGYDVAFLHYDRPRPGAERAMPWTGARFGIAEEGLEGAIGRARAWTPQVCYSHNMRFLEIEDRLLREWPVVKMMHGYFGTCIGGQKSFSFPTSRPCDRRFGAACLACYLPRGCGRFSLGEMTRQYRWARAQRKLFPRYAAFVVASDHMKREYARNGAPEKRIHAVPLFPANRLPADAGTAPTAEPAQVLFLGRMIRLKGGDLLIRAMAEAAGRLARPLALVMAGDGPQRHPWEQLAGALNVSVTFTGWLEGEALWRAMQTASALALPSVWPEPFGLVGLEAGQCGVPAVAFDVGGVRQWLQDGSNGTLVPADPPSAAAFADGILRLFERPERLAAMRQSAREVSTRMSLGAHLETLERVLALAGSAS